MRISNKEEPISAPNPDRWYTLTLGSSFKEQTQKPSSKFCTLRYEFKPASIDKTQPGSLHKSKDNKINVEFPNTQPGKPKVIFEGSSEDYKENDAVLFFDGATFRLERLHRSVKRLKHVRLPGESTSSTVVEVGSPPVGRGVKGPAQNLNVRTGFSQLPLPPPPPPLVPVEVERINIGNAGGSGGKPRNEELASTSPTHQTGTVTPESDDFDIDAQLDIMNDDEDETNIALDTDVKTNNEEEEKPIHTGIDINMPHQHADTDEEIADVDINDDNGVMGGSAAEALRAQVNAGDREGPSSSSSSASESSESSESSSSSGDSESSEADSVNSI